MDFLTSICLISEAHIYLTFKEHVPYILILNCFLRFYYNTRLYSFSFNLLIIICPSSLTPWIPDHHLVAHSILCLWTKVQNPNQIHSALIWCQQLCNLYQGCMIYKLKTRMAIYTLIVGTPRCSISPANKIIKKKKTWTFCSSPTGLMHAGGISQVYKNTKYSSNKACLWSF